MLSNLQYLNLPTKVIVAIIILLVVSNIIGEVLELKGKVVPEVIKLRKYFIRKKQEREIMEQMPAALERVQRTIDDFMSHYNEDNMKQRDRWIKNVNKKLEDHEKWRIEFDKKLDKNNEDTLSLLIDNKRNSIIDFASRVIDESNPVTREQFNRVFKIHADYERIISDNNMTNGEVDIAFRIINEAYATHMKNHTFVEDLRGY